jgi:hypothetical protein
LRLLGGATIDLPFLRERQSEMAKVQEPEIRPAESRWKRANDSAGTAVLPLFSVRRILHRGFQALLLRPRGHAPILRFLSTLGLLPLVFGSQAAMAQSPALISPLPGSVLHGATVTFTWTAVNYASSFKLELGSTARNTGDLGIYTAGRTTASSISVRATGLPTNGAIVYATLSWIIGGYAYKARSAYLAAFHGTSSAPAIDSLSCAGESFTGSATDLCTLKLNTAAGKNGTSIELASSDSAANVPDSVKVPAGGKTATFTAEIAAVYRAQTAILMATDGKSSRTFPIKLNTGSSVLELESRSVAFGNVPLNSPSTQSLKLASTGRNPLVIDSLTIAGKGFRMSGPRFPMALDPGKFVVVDLEFDPAAIGTAFGALTIVSNSTTGHSTLIRLSGTGQKISYQVRLTWEAPSTSAVSIAGYRVFRATGGSSYYGLLNDSPDPDTTYTDETVQSGADYVYYVETVDAAGVSSAPSKTLSIAIP